MVFRSEAEQEFEYAHDYYNSIRRELGLQFLTQVEIVLTRISLHPQIHQVVFEDIRKGVVKRFPYCVFYRAHPDRIEVISVFDARQDPKLWQSRV